VEDVADMIGAEPGLLQVLTMVDVEVLSWEGYWRGGMQGGGM